MSNEYDNPPLWFTQFAKHTDDEFKAIKKLLESFVDQTINNTERLIKIETKIEAYEKDLNNLGIKNTIQHEEFYKHLNNNDKHQDLKLLVEKNEDRSESNELEIAKIKTTATTSYILFGLLIALVGALSKMGVI